MIVIMIMPCDPFGKNRMVYTIRNGCVEEPDMPYDDGAKTIFLYTGGEVGNPTQELKDLLRYMKKTNFQNARNEMLREIHKMVEYVKQDAEVSLAYMRMMKREEDIARKARNQAVAELEEVRAKVAEEMQEVRTKAAEEMQEVRTKAAEEMQEVRTKAAKEAADSALKLFQNGVSYDVVRVSIASLSDEELREIYKKSGITSRKI